MHDLDDLFAEARDKGRDAPPALLARVMADAEAAQAAAPARRGFRMPRWLTAALTGGAALTGMATAALAGVWIGYAEPEAFSGVTNALWADQVDLMPSYTFLQDQE